ncbi:unnamed protein product [Prorocentrum cordatum]|uniref:Uncharacterized protein n=1 Tax=Prorocentrum cordatum TaxID=2364126 RepID=A0ABN9RKL2_9DINO|nr:unnamed protein product [Polarella glacialis]
MASATGTSKGDPPPLMAMPLGVVLIFLSVAVPNAVLLYFFSAVDDMQGLRLYNMVSPNQMSLAGDGVLFIAFLTCSLLYVFGWVEWGRTCQGIALVLPWMFIVAPS